MDEEAVRALVREAVSRHLGNAETGARQVSPLRLAGDPSHYRYTLPETDGPCLIEPSVQCTHCGYCQSHGH
jgi:hypothetical protein